MPAAPAAQAETINTLDYFVSKHQDKGLSASTTYYYAVMAYDRDAGTSGYSNQPNATTSAAGTTSSSVTRRASGVTTPVWKR